MTTSLTLPTKTAFVLTWTLADTQGNAINNAVVTATLYAGRSLRDPDAILGTIVAPINGLPMAYVNLSAGMYSVSVPGTLDPAAAPGLNGAGFVLVIDGSVSGTPIYHTEQPVAIQVAGASIDLTILDSVKQRAEVVSERDDVEIQAAITGFSQWLLDYTGRASLNSIVALDEVYDGNGNARLFLRNYPVVSIVSVTMNGIALPLSGGSGSWGIYVDQSKRSIALRGGMGNFSTFPYPNRYGTGGVRRGPVFVRDQGNIEVVYSAGYGDTPYDLEYAVRCVVALNYKRKAWQDQKSRGVSTQGASATTAYRDWDFPPEYRSIFEFYQRKAII